ncbi:HdeD family acid-resistance protein [Cellulosimicrobium protaetiae]|uniref:HdeD family acid-resistance protein n=1 Tax=Cellulosimicrobium protaetiae TaxID=2587808 RepID=A0A6M5U8Q9_9MICO|nr:HdeD family acid-resistance protein [Cellulosimicrobium protaetiae]QJW34907.1 HdeD family acid-resistance protein [Cellulosimicrobium protaetiae]
MTTQDPILTAFSSTAKQVWYWPVLRGVLAILFGVVALSWPDKTAAVVIWVIGVFAVVDGLVEIIEGIRRRGTGSGTAFLVTMGVLSLAVGIVLLVWPGKTAIVLTWIVGFWAVVYGLFQTVASLDLRKIPGSGWGWGVFAGVLGLVFGLLVLFNVNAGLVSIVWLLALFAIVWGVMLIAFGFQIRSLGKQAGRATTY